MEVPPKIRHFWWRACIDALATKSNLFKHKCSPSELCLECLKETESVEHLLFDCSWMKAVWFGSLLSLPLEQGTVHNIEQWTAKWLGVGQESEDVSGIELISKIALIGWFIWKARNNLVFNHMPVNPSEVIQKCSQAWFEHNRHCNGSSTRSPEGPLLHPPSHRWRSATHSGIKINCDATFNQKHLKASAAAIMPDRRGRLLDGLVSSFSASSALLAEAQAICLACFLAQEHNTSLVEIESDNQSLIKLCVSEDVPLGSVWQRCLTFEASQSCNNGSLVGPVEQTTGQCIGLLVPMLAKNFLLIGWITHLWPLFLFCLVMLPVRCFVL